MSGETLTAAAIRRFRFRARRPHETADRYRAALIDFVATRDFAAAHELRLGKPQADWTPADVQSFSSHLEKVPRASQEFSPGVHAFPFLTDAGPYPTTDDELLALARRGLDQRVAFRQEHPQDEMAILASVLLMNGQLLHTTTSRRDRIAVLKMLVRNEPVFGYFIVADTYIHAIERHPVTGATQKASKRDALLVHVGSRTLRRALVRPYHFAGGAALFDEPYEVEGSQFGEDPYAEIFVSVPAPQGPPS